MRAGKERLQGSVNGDGFGVGWYDDAFARDPSEQLDEPCIFTSIQPAWNNLNLARLARKLRSPLLFAHVRAAYPGMPVFEGNCHPFVFGRYMCVLVPPRAVPALARHGGGSPSHRLVLHAPLWLLRGQVDAQRRDRALL